MSFSWTIPSFNYVESNQLDRLITGSDLMTLRNKVVELNLSNRCTVDFRSVFTIYYSVEHETYFTNDNNTDHNLDRKAFMEQYYEGNLYVDGRPQNGTQIDRREHDLYPYKNYQSW